MGRGSPGGGGKRWSRRPGLTVAFGILKLTLGRRVLEEGSVGCSGEGRSIIYSPWGGALSTPTAPEYPRRAEGSRNPVFPHPLPGIGRLHPKHPIETGKLAAQDRPPPQSAFPLPRGQSSARPGAPAAARDSDLKGPSRAGLWRSSWESGPHLGPERSRSGGPAQGYPSDVVVEYRRGLVRWRLEPTAKEEFLSCRWCKKVLLFKQGDSPPPAERAELGL